jgi:transcriptional regulator with XRE-family HTH domain
VERASEHLAARLRHLRRKERLTQHQRAAKAGTSRATIARLENETRVPKLGTLAQIAEALEVDVDDLFKG